MTTGSPRERLYELLADRALVGLGPAEESELEALLRQHPGADVEGFEEAAAAIAIASVTGALDPLPPKLAAKIEEDAGPALAKRPPKHLVETYVMPDRPAAPAPPRPLATTVPMPDAPALPAARQVQSAPIHVQPARIAQPPSNVVPLAAAPSRGRAFAIAGWVAAAACLVLAVGAFVLKKPTIVTVAPPATSAPPPVDTAPPPPAKLREQLLAEVGTTRVAWSSTKDPAAKGASGDVVWNAAEQRGYMLFRGLAKNDPSAWQYQLWIFDKARDDKYPVDGGVFDVDASTGDVVVPIRAKLPVAEAALFAVTVEKPGGVVVSKRERIVVTAKPSG
jgi:hypothetical protein